MKRCYELASKAIGFQKTNPMVGCVLVHENEIIGEGWHNAFGEPHAEVEALEDVAEPNRIRIPHSTLYVTLEPCFHEGKTPPCVQRILEEQIGQVVISNLDPNPATSGKSIKRLHQNDILVTHGILSEFGTQFNKRFFTQQAFQRPYVILKFAQSADGYIGSDEKRTQITGEEAMKLSHRWRSEEDAILVGTNTVRIDNPQLTTRLQIGRNPVRVVLDKANKLKGSQLIFDGQAPTILFNISKRTDISEAVTQIQKVDLMAVLTSLYNLNVGSIIIEGGAQTINRFIEADLWDEARVFTSNKILNGGVVAPKYDFIFKEEKKVGDDILKIAFNHQTPFH